MNKETRQFIFGLICVFVGAFGLTVFALDITYNRLDFLSFVVIVGAIITIFFGSINIKKGI